MSPGNTSTTIDYQGISLDAYACPVGGSIHAVSVASTSTQTEDIAGTAVFGPACGDVR